MSFTEGERPGQLIAHCDAPGCPADKYVYVTTLNLAPGMQELQKVVQILADDGWTQKVIQGTWPGQTLCPMHGPKAGI